MKFQFSHITKSLLAGATGGLLLLHGSGFSLTSADAQQKSAVQQELEKLYQQQGRPAPNMSAGSMSRQTASPTAPAPNYNPSRLSTNRLPAVRRTKKKSFLDRLMFWKKDEPVTRTFAKPGSQPATPESTPTPNATSRSTQPGLSPRVPNSPVQRESVPSRRKESMYVPIAPPSALPSERPVSNRTVTPPAMDRNSGKQPVTLEMPAKDEPRAPELVNPSETPPLPEWTPSAPAQPSRKPVARPEPVRKPIISAAPKNDGPLPRIIPKVPPSPSLAPGENRVIIGPDQNIVSEEPKPAPSLPDTNDPVTTPEPPAAGNPFADAEETGQPRPMPQDVEPAPRENEPAVATQPQIPEQTPAAAAEQPQESDQPMPAAKLPNLDELPEEPLPLVPEEEKPVAEQTSPQAESFPDPFTDVSEQEADSSKNDMTIPDIRMNDAAAAEIPAEEDSQEPFSDSEEPADENAVPKLPADPMEDADESPEEPVLEDENPFSGLKLDSPEAPAPPLDDEPEAAPMLPSDGDEAAAADEVEAPSAAPALPDIDPAFDDDFKLPVKKDTEDEPMIDHPILEKIPENPSPELPPADEGDISWEEEQARREAKLALIAAREGETGMKGFCIVELRDARDLVDAVPAFRSTYNLRTYHFSSLEAKIKFDKEPRKYVPAYDGNDPILLSTQSEEREGSLDHALWFKGRLYLFTSQGNLEVFQQDPVLYSEN